MFGVDVTVFQIAYFVVNPINGQYERTGYDHVIPFDVVLSSQNPFDFGYCGRNQMLAFFFTKQDDGGIGDLTTNRNSCLVQECDVVP